MLLLERQSGSRLRWDSIGCGCRLWMRRLVGVMGLVVPTTVVELASKMGGDDHEDNDEDGGGVEPNRRTVTHELDRVSCKQCQ